MNLQRTLFILPNMFTLANVFCGFFALALCAGGASSDELYQAALAICFGFFFDLLDGRVARLTKTQSKLGVELDSLADVITFGAAPALLVYKWGLTQFGLWGVFIAFLFVGCGAFRLARFNVLTERNDYKPSSAYFIGLSIPVAAAVIVSLVVVHHKVGGEFVVYGQGALAALVIILSYLMISRVRFRSFKHVRMSKRTLSMAFLLTMICLVIAVKLRASFIFVFLTTMYLAAGLAEEVFRYAAEKRRVRRERKLAQGEHLSPDDEDVVEDDADVLRELGAEP